MTDNPKIEVQPSEQALLEAVICTADGKVHVETMTLTGDDPGYGEGAAKLWAKRRELGRIKMQEGGERPEWATHVLVLAITVTSSVGRRAPSTTQTEDAPIWFAPVSTLAPAEAPADTPAA